VETRLLQRVDPTSREPVTTEIARKLVAYLLSGTVQPGEKIPSERRLAEVFGVGRSIVREALKSLTLLGLVEVRQGDGTYLKRPDSELLPQAIEWGLLLGVKRTTDLVEVRRHLEVICAGLAAERRDETALADLRSLLGKMRAAGRDANSFVEADIAFHLRLAQAAENQALSEILSSIRSLLRVWIARVIGAAGDSSPSYEEHVPILEAVERGDAAAAREAMEVHMARASKRLAATLESDGLRQSGARRSAQSASTSP